MQHQLGVQIGHELLRPVFSSLNELHEKIQQSLVLRFFLMGHAHLRLI